jgi:dTDP-4-amino-4,6-dideoxygalactose transaminase
MEEAHRITNERLSIWNRYDEQLSTAHPLIATPTVPENCSHNAHMYFVINQTMRSRDDILANLKNKGITSVFHYVPLHSSPFGRKFSKSPVNLPVTDYVAANLFRLPIWIGLDETRQTYVIRSLLQEIGSPAEKNLASPNVEEFY